MISSIKFFLRLIEREKLYSVISIVGLAIGLSVSLLMALFVIDELSVDRWVPEGERVYLVQSTWSVPNRDVMEAAGTPGPLSGLLVEEFGDQIDAISRIYATRMTVKHEDRQFRERIIMAEPGFFQIFQFPELQGSAEKSLDNNTSIAVTPEMAQKYFANADPLGKILTLNDGTNTVDYQVVAVVDPLKGKTHFSFDMIALLDPSRFTTRDYVLERWSSFNIATYVKLKSTVAASFIERRLPDLVDSSASFRQPIPPGSVSSDFLKFSLIPLHDIYLFTGHLVAKIDPGGNISFVVSFALISALVLALAIINFTNLTLARSMRRTNEVALRKVFGAARSDLVKQFLIEAITTTLIALVLAFLAVELALPYFNSFVGKDLSLTALSSPVAILGTGILALLVGCAGGAYPAFAITTKSTAIVLREKSGANSPRSHFQGLLVLLQFAAAIGLFTATVVTSEQTKFAQGVNLGFEKENRLTIAALFRGNVQPLARELRDRIAQLPGVEDVAVATDSIPQGSVNNLAFEVPGDAGGDGRSLEVMGVEPQFFKTLGIPFIEGEETIRRAIKTRDVLAPRDAQQSSATNPGYVRQVVLNEDAVSYLGFTSAKEAIGKSVFTPGNRDGAQVRVRTDIVAVIPNLRSRSARQANQPMAFFVDGDGFYADAMTVKVDPNRRNETLREIERIWRDVAPGIPIIRYWMPDSIDRIYTDELRREQILSYLSAMALVISGLGLFGLAAISTEKRTREIGIRKVLGASVGNIVALLVYQFSRPVLLANLIAVPVVWMAMQDWLDGFAHRIQLTPWPFMIAGSGALVVALLTVSYHAVRSARTHPATILRYE